MKLPTEPTVYYCPKRDEIVLITPSHKIIAEGYCEIQKKRSSFVIPGCYLIEFEDCWQDIFEDKSYLDKNWPHLVKIGEL